MWTLLTHGDFDSFSSPNWTGWTNTSAAGGQVLDAGDLSGSGLGIPNPMGTTHTPSMRGQASAQTSERGALRSDAFALNYNYLYLWHYSDGSTTPKVKIYDSSDNLLHTFDLTYSTTWKFERLDVSAYNGQTIKVEVSCATAVPGAGYFGRFAHVGVGNNAGTIQNTGFEDWQASDASRPQYWVREASGEENGRSSTHYADSYSLKIRNGTSTSSFAVLSSWPFYLADSQIHFFHYSENSNVVFRIRLLTYSGSQLASWTISYQGSWHEEVLDVNAYKNQDVRLEIAQHTGQTPYGWGTFVDAVSLTSPSVEETETITLSDDLSACGEVSAQQDADTTVIHDTYEMLMSDASQADSISLIDALTNWILCWLKTDLADTTTLSDALTSVIMGQWYDLGQKISTKLVTFVNCNQKINTCIRVLSNILNHINTAFRGLYNCNNKINTKALVKSDLENDFRMIQSWMIPGDAGFQSKGKEFIHVYISGAEATDVDIDSITINKTIGAPATASFDLARAYDSTRPTAESLVEIYYDSWKLYRGYITDIVPADKPEKITINCADEYWKQNQTKVYFQVGRKPSDDIELYYETIATALATGCSYSPGVGGFIPQTFSCFGAGKADAISQLLQTAGNFNVYYDESGNPALWQAGFGNEIWIEPQEIGKNLGLYQVLSHQFRESVADIVNQYRVQMGQQVIRRFGSTGSSKKYSGYEFRTVTEWADPDWNPTYETIAKNSGTGYGWDYHLPADDQYYGKVYKAYKLPTLDVELEDWTDRYEPEVSIFLPFGGIWECNIPSGKMTEGFTIDYQNKTLTFNEPVFLFQKNAYGEITDYRRPEIRLWLWKKKYYSKTTSPGDNPQSDISNPLMFFTSKMGTYPTTIQGSLELQGLGIQIGGWYQTGDGTYQYVPSWDDTSYAVDYANWQLSKVCDKKVAGEIELTLDAVCFYNLTMAKRVMIDGVLDDSLNIVGMSFNLSTFTVNVQLESGRYFARSISIPSHGE